MISLDACNVCQTYPATASLHPAVQMTLAGSAHGGTWGLSLPRLLSAGDSLSLTNVRILTLSDLRFFNSSFYRQKIPLLPTIVYALPVFLSIFFHCMFRLQPPEFFLAHCTLRPQPPQPAQANENASSRASRGAVRVKSVRPQRSTCESLSMMVLLFCEWFCSIVPQSRAQKKGAHPLPCSGPPAHTAVDCYGILDVVGRGAVFVLPVRIQLF